MAIISELFDLEGSKVLITGGGKGLGKVTALALAEAGCDVSILDIDLPSAEQIAGEINKMGRRALALKADVIRKEEVEKAFATTAQEFGRLDVCVNNAAICINEAAENVPEELYDRVLDTNLKGVFLCCQQAGKIMIPQRSGSIINISSISSRLSTFPEKHSYYNASKAGVVLLTKCLAVEWAGHGIRVNVLSPGYTWTDMISMMAHLFPQWQARIPMGRVGDPREFVGAIIYLASGASSYTTGSEVIVDGGYTAR
ncbi:MAG: SDR family oxidoreductase [Dehalococcoidales bacterium]|nr:SDR family oxidoreductase [Dehalococcoidales bacterium]